MAEGNSSNCDVMELSEAVKFICRHAQDVSVNRKKIKKVAQDVVRYLMNHIESFNYSNTYVMRPITYPVSTTLTTADWLFVLHTLNFSLWYPKDSKQWKVNGKKGYIGLCNAINRAYEDGKPIWNPEYYTKMTKSELECILQSDDGEPEIPLIDERLRILHEVGEVLLQKYKGTFMECLKSSEYDADKLMKLLFDEFESYRDEVKYDGKKVCFLVKARSLVIDIWDYFKESPNKFKLNKSKMMSTIFTDYCIPQLLFKLKILQYSGGFKKRLKNSNVPLEHGSREEIEIRGCSLFAANKIYKEVKKLIERLVLEKRLSDSVTPVTQLVVDNFLLKFIFTYNYDNNSLKKYPLHYIRTVHY
ncbi:queuosine salvage protein-like [Nylanderia fulva]|uniref:queuosine salvage protein-like n=1 Tax=Nylanderia fulva TaxID=613905 RepID=UPI0010FBA64E|nr:queuosine salvage protein-like [Nylanderia fulva]